MKIYLSEKKTPFGEFLKSAKLMNIITRQLHDGGEGHAVHGAVANRTGDLHGFIGDLSF